MNSILVAVLTVLVATGLGLLSNIVANKIQPRVEKRTRLIVIMSSFLVGIAIVLAVVSVTRPPSSDKPPITDNLTITSLKTVEDSETQIQPLGDQGVISVYWETMLSNVGETSLSVISYNVRQVGDDFPAVMYSGMNQGLYSFENGRFKTLDMPIELTAGSTRKVFVRLGLLMTPESFELVRGQFKDSASVTLQPIWHFLFSKGTDFYGNKIERLPKGTGYSLPSTDRVREQIFVISFKTSRGLSVDEPVSWYKYGGAYDMRRHQ